MAETHHRFRLLRLFPADDVEFTTFAEATFATIGEVAGPEELERLLRECYPSVRVRRQERPGMSGALRSHWYVFRDGRIVTAVRPAE